MRRHTSLILTGALLALGTGSDIRATNGRDDVAPPAAKKVPHVREMHGDRFDDAYFWLREKSNPEVVKYLEAENGYTEAAMKPFAPLQETLYKEMLGRIKETDLSVPARKDRLLLLFAHRAGQAVPHPLPEEGQPRGGRGDHPRRQRAGEGPEVHGRRRAQRQRRWPPARLLDRQHRLPRVSPVREGPAHRRGAREPGGEGEFGGVGRRQPHAVLQHPRCGQAALPRLPPRRRRRKTMCCCTRRRTSASASGSRARAARATC